MAKWNPDGGDRSMVHLNRNIMCSTDCETTGLRVGYHEITQVCFMPLNEKLEPHTNHLSFDMLIKPEHPERMEKGVPNRAKQICWEAVEHGYPAAVAFELFERWYKELGLHDKRRIVPLAFNWPFERMWYIDWMGWENFNFYIDGAYRDLLALTHMHNDRSDFHVEKARFPTPERKLATVCRNLGVDVEDARLHDCIYDSYLTAKAYKAALLLP